MSENRPDGTLFVVATPIGNLDDITLRAVDVLKTVAIVAAEDTRRSAGAVSAYRRAPGAIVVAARPQRRRRVPSSCSTLLQQGHDVALISDAGTPLISDPGFELVRHLRANGVRVVPIPGPSALTAVLSASPLPVERFFFEGFLPVALRRAPQATCANWRRLRSRWFSSKRRVDCAKRCRISVKIIEADRQILLAKELTKIHERIE